MYTALRRKSGFLSLVLQITAIFDILLTLLLLGSFITGFMEVTDLNEPRAMFALFDIGFSTHSNNTIDYYILLGNSLLANALFIAMLFKGSFIFKDISNGLSPFDAIQVKRLKNIFWLYVSSAVLPLILDNVLHWLITFSGYYRFRVDLGEILIALLLYTVAEIFSYGSSLQQEIDETL